MRIFTSKLTGTPAPPILYVSYRSRKHQRDLTWAFPLADVCTVRVGLPKVEKGGARGGLLGALFTAVTRTPKATLSLTLEDDKGGTLLHLEAGGPHQLDALLRTLSTLAQWARARAGRQEGLPEATLLPPEEDATHSSAAAFNF
jgi:hypothetical protein